MKRLICVILSVSVFNAVLAQECQLPNSLAGMSISFHLYGIKSDSNPFANDIIEMRFSEKTYRLIILDTGKEASGTYTYQRYEMDLAEIRLSEQKVINGKVKIGSYTNTLVCQTDHTGLYIFSELNDVRYPQSRQNPGRYFFNQNF